MATTVVITKTAQGNFNIAYTSAAKTFSKPFNPDVKFDVSGDNQTITLISPCVSSAREIMPTYELPAAWTIDGVTGFTTVTQVTEALKAFGVGNSIAAASAAIALNQPMYVDSNFTLTRPANTTPYDINDAILSTVGIATQKFAGIAKSAGRGVNFINLAAFTNDTGLSGKTINVVFYKQSPTSPIADNAAFSYTAANELIRKGTVQLTFGTGVLAGVAQLGIDSNGILNLELCPTATDVYVQVWLPAAYTPSANSTYIIFKASAIQN